MILPQSYLDETCGVRPAPNQASFNNIIYSVWYTIARQRQGNLTQDDLNGLFRHIELNTDEYGLYKPKNSHDNVTYKAIAYKLFDSDKMDDMSFLEAVKAIGIYRIWDVIFYGALFGPKLLRPLFRLFIFIPALQMVEACYNEGKVKPDWFDGTLNGRIHWWFRRGKLIEEIDDGIRVHKKWSFNGEEARVSVHMQNDGKHLALFKLYTFKDDFLAFKIAAKVCKKILIKRYGNDYTYGIINKYFLDRKHPVIAMWKGYGDIL